MNKMVLYFTSESVTEGHPDKIADQISDAVLDSILKEDPQGKVAAETLVTTGLVLVAGEITTNCYVDIPQIARQTVREIGYTRAKYGFDGDTCAVLTSIDGQSPDIALGVNESWEMKEGKILIFMTKLVQGIRVLFLVLLVMKPQNLCPFPLLWRIN